MKNIKYLNHKKRLILEELKKYDLDEKFVEALIQSNGIISGFFILKALLKKFRKNNKIETDIDIYLNMSDIRKRFGGSQKISEEVHFSEEEKKKIPSFKEEEKNYRPGLHRLGNKKITPEKLFPVIGNRNCYYIHNFLEKLLLPIEKYFLKKINYNPRNFKSYNSQFDSSPGLYEEFGVFNISNVCEFYLEKIKVQIIYLNTDIVWFVQNMFDLNFLKNCFDGNNLWSYNYNSLKTKTSEHKSPIDKNIDENKIKILARCIKYKNRGFKITNFKNIANTKISFPFEYSEIHQKNICRLKREDKYAVQVLEYYLKYGKKKLPNVDFFIVGEKHHPISKYEIIDVVNYLKKKTDHHFKYPTKVIKINSLKLHAQLNYLTTKYSDIGNIVIDLDKIRNLYHRGKKYIEKRKYFQKIFRFMIQYLNLINIPTKTAYYYRQLNVPFINNSNLQKQHLSFVEKKLRIKATSELEASIYFVIILIGYSGTNTSSKITIKEFFEKIINSAFVEPDIYDFTKYSRGLGRRVLGQWYSVEKKDIRKHIFSDSYSTKLKINSLIQKETKFEASEREY